MQVVGSPGGAGARIALNSAPRAPWFALRNIRVQRMTFAASNFRAFLASGARKTLFAGAVAGVAVGLASCSTFDDWNPFAPAKYKTVIEPDVPASKVYDQGLAQLANGAPQAAAKKFTDLGDKFP